MRLILCAVAVALSFLKGSLAVTTLSVGSCADLQVAAAGTATDDVIAELEVEDIECPSWTTFEVTNNRLKIVAGGELTNDDGFFFHNVRFDVSSVLRFEFHAHFSGDMPGDDEVSTHVVNGGILKVASGARVRFMSHVFVTGITISSGTNDPLEITPDAGHGGCFYNEGLIRFERTLETIVCTTDGAGQSGMGDGGTLWNGQSGRVVVKGEVNMQRSGADAGSLMLDAISLGGIIYNQGYISIFDDAAFSNSRASEGAAFFNIGTIKLLSASTGSFVSNYATYDGGHLYNIGTILMKAGAVFYEGFSAVGSGGAIFNTGSVIIEGLDGFSSSGVEFNGNAAAVRGGAIATLSGAVLELPDDTVFDANYMMDFSGDVNCDDIYFETESGYTCLP